MRPDGVALMGAPAPAGVSRSGGLAARAPETWGAPDPPYLKPVQHRGQYSGPQAPQPAARRPALGFNASGAAGSIHFRESALAPAPLKCR